MCSAFQFLQQIISFAAVETAHVRRTLSFVLNIKQQQKYNENPTCPKYSSIAGHKKK